MTLSEALPSPLEGTCLPESQRELLLCAHIPQGPVLCMVMVDPNIAVLLKSCMVVQTWAQVWT